MTIPPKLIPFVNKFDEFWNKILSFNVSETQLSPAVMHYMFCGRPIDRFTPLLI